MVMYMRLYITGTILSRYDWRFERTSAAVFRGSSDSSMLRFGTKLTDAEGYGLTNGLNSIICTTDRKDVRLNFVMSTEN